MWLLNALFGGKCRRRLAPCALLCAGWLVLCVPPARALPGGGADGRPELREKDVRRAENVLAKLRRLEEAAAAQGDAGAFRALAADFYPGLFVTVAEMRDGDLKTDLGTAAFLYEEVGRAWHAAGARAADCGRERPDIYLPLCLGLRGGTARQLLVARAALHTLWAAAVVKEYRGVADASTAADLAAMREARRNDLLIAARVVETLRPLEGLVNLSKKPADEEAGRAAAKVSFEKLEGEFAEALGRAGVLLGWLPRGPAYYRLSSARRGYLDGLFWYQKVRQSGKLVVSAERFERDELKDLGLDPGRTGRTVAANWMSAARYTRLVEESVSVAARR